MAQSTMVDIKALAILKHQMDTLQKISLRPGDNAGIPTSDIEEEMRKTSLTVGHVNTYLNDIQEQMKGLRKTLKQCQERMQNAIEELFQKLKATTNTKPDDFTSAVGYHGTKTDEAVHQTKKPFYFPHIGTNQSTSNSTVQKYQSNVDILKSAHTLQKALQSTMELRLNEVMDETEKALTKAQDGADLTNEDVEHLIGSIDSLRNVKDESYKQEQKRKQEEERRKLEEERTAAEEERKQQEERDRISRENARKEAEKQREEEERQEREREEAGAMRKEEERQRVEAEKAERERQRLEAEQKEQQRKQEEAYRKEKERQRRAEVEQRRKAEQEEKRRREQDEHKRKVEEDWKRKQLLAEVRELEKQQLKEMKLAKEKQRLEEERQKQEFEKTEKEKRKKEREKAEEKRKEKEKLRIEAEEAKKEKQKLEKERKEQQRRQQAAVRKEKEGQKRELANLQKKNEEEEMRRREEEERMRKKEQDRIKSERGEKGRERKRLLEEENIEKERQRIHAEQLKNDRERVERQMAEEKSREEERHRIEEEEAEKERQRFEADQIEHQRKGKEAERMQKEKQRLIDEQKEREMRKQEEADRIRRLDPKNWKFTTYNRSSDEVGGRNASHEDIGCILTSSETYIDEETIVSTTSDELDSVIDILDDGEKIASSIVDLRSICGPINSEVPSRLFIPHFPMTNSRDEIIVKCSVNDSDWITPMSVNPTPNITTSGIPTSNLIGIEINDFETVKAVAVARPAGQTIIVDEPGIMCTSEVDRNVRVSIPRGAFNCSTEIRLLVQPIQRDAWSDGDGTMSNTPFISIFCQIPPMKDIEIDVRSPKVTTRKRTRHQLGVYATKRKVWNVIEVDRKGMNDEMTIVLPSRQDTFHVVGMESSIGTAQDTLALEAQTLYEQVTRTPIRALVRQHKDKPNEAVVVICSSVNIRSEEQDLKVKGYTLGPEMSRVYRFRDGQKVSLSCAGNLATTRESSGQISMSFFAYMKPAMRQLTLEVKDTYRQKDLPHFIGTMKLTVEDGTEFSDEIIEFVMTLPKYAKPRVLSATAKIQLPYYTSLVVYLSIELCEESSFDWEDLLKQIIGERFNAVYRQAKRKVDTHDDKKMCQTLLIDWMKSRPVTENKVQPITDVLLNNGLLELHKSCKDFVAYQRDVMTNDAIRAIIEKSSKGISEVEKNLQLPDDMATQCNAELFDCNNDRLFAMLCKWRETEEAVKLGTTALRHLKSICDVNDD